MKKLTNEEFIYKANKIHNNKYDYSNINYIDNKTKVEIICLKHGCFEQTPASHLSGNGCPNCIKNTTETFINKAKLVHGDKYDYSFVDYINSYTKVKIICPIHGTFEQIPNDHLNNHGCPMCNESKGEKLIKKILTENNIAFEKQKKFSDLKDVLPLSYDFYIPSKNLLIEYNGIQHYSCKSFNKSYKNFLLQKHHDWLKRKYALKNNYNLLIINYNEDIKECLLKVNLYD